MSGGHGGARRTRARQRIVEVAQDGVDFYDKSTDEILFTSTQHLESVWDMDGAHAARREFRVWCRVHDIRPLFEGTL